MWVLSKLHCSVHEIGANEGHVLTWCMYQPRVHTNQECVLTRSWY